MYAFSTKCTDTFEADYLLPQSITIFHSSMPSMTWPKNIANSTGWIYAAKGRSFGGAHQAMGLMVMKTIRTIQQFWTIWAYGEILPPRSPNLMRSSNRPQNITFAKREYTVILQSKRKSS
ncbi:hypothetical protein J4E81_009749 [Alternaria sp. BMP 2799]|nr:hypothetical protein J4E81_009749 [Alternaria sp. BMP 2799]